MTQNAISGYELLLNSFGTDPVEAGRLLQLQRDKIIAYFDFKGSGIIEGDRLTDEVFDIAIKNLQDGEPIQNIRAYLHGIAKLVLCNYYREVEHDQRKLEEYQYLLKTKILSADEGEEERETLRIECNRRCLQQIDSANKELLIEYSRGSAQAREALSQRHGISRNSLTIRINRIRSDLRKCKTECMKNKHV
jgi:DNA-directed RNA polymerase specialized sigma24 family protein